MRKLIPVFFLSALFLIGCATRTAYNTLATVGYTVDSAVSAYFDGVVKGSFPTNGVPKVSLAYNLFQADYRVALKIAQYNTNAIAPPNILVDQQNVLNTIGASK